MELHPSNKVCGLIMLYFILFVFVTNTNTGPNLCKQIDSALFKGNNTFDNIRINTPITTQNYWIPQGSYNRFLLYISQSHTFTV